MSTAPSAAYAFPGIYHPTALEVIDHVCNYRGVALEDLKARNRMREIVLVRQECMYLIRRHCKNVSLPSIGRMFNRDHTTVLHSLKSLQDYIDTTPDYRADFKNLSDSLFNKPL